MGCSSSKGGADVTSKKVAHDTVPIIVVSQRHVPDGTEAEFRAQYEKSVRYMMDNVPGVKAIFY